MSNDLGGQVMGYYVYWQSNGLDKFRQDNYEQSVFNEGEWPSSRNIMFACWFQNVSVDIFSIKKKRPCLLQDTAYQTFSFSLSLVCS